MSLAAGLRIQGFTFSQELTDKGPIGPLG